ncbi:aminoacyl-tRNA hydrolase [Acuticoccus sediminis]|uniref:Peptidyl-tRNA hydrolase n=1 Tax=Acuticoccus sediminis TaxID=2184697 RepID=A0A8B2NN40_9HYPH|nr:aminoacyl-tRNA hydrolase [Acuticoccus sediminis]
MKLIVGLGNPGKEYAMNRHNVGFMAVDRLHDRWNGAPWRTKFQSEVAEATIDGTRVLLMKPTTFMNLSGHAVAEAARFYKVDLSDIIIVHDEIDLPPGKFKMKTGGGTGGHNGLKSLSSLLKDGYRRLRIGVGHPGRKELVPGYVLKDFPKADQDWLEPMLTAFAEEAPLLATGDDAKFASKVHLRLGEGARSTGAARRAARSAARAEAEKAAAGKAETAGEETPAAAPSPKPAPERGTDTTASGPFAALANLLRK